MVGRLFQPTGENLHPTVVVLHGFPGVQQNHDLAFDLVEEGWNVLLFNYRGTWGSQGNFSFVHALEDVQAALAYLRQEDIAATYLLDLSKLVLIGHSMGGFLSCLTTAQDLGVQAVASISGFNFGLVAESVGDDEAQFAQVAAMLDEGTLFLNGIDGATLAQQAKDHRAQWNLIRQASALADRPVFLLGAKRDEVGPVDAHHHTLVQALEKSGAQRLQHVVVDTDHNWDDQRATLISHLRDWLRTI